MNREAVDRVAKALLYEGYLLYPYRPSSVKNQQRFNFGVLFPQSYCDSQAGHESSNFHIECLVQGSVETELTVVLRFLHLRTRTTRQLSGRCGESASDIRQENAGHENASEENNWQEAVERDAQALASTLGQILHQDLTHSFTFPPEAIEDAEYARYQAAIEGLVELSAEAISRGLFKLSINVRNTLSMPDPAVHRSAALMYALVSSHVVLGVSAGEFVSLLEPPPELEVHTAQCHNIGVFPVLVGEPGNHDTLLASPIILYDYPSIAPESAGDLFDGTEIDEILSLRIMTLTDDEKREIRQSDERAQKILERTDALPPEQLMKLHGAMRSQRPSDNTAKENPA